MRVTFDHRQNRNNFIVDATVEFSEEEKAVIAQRGLSEHLITAKSTATGRVSGGIEPDGTISIMIRIGVFILAIGGFITIVVAMFGGPGILPVLCFGGAGVLWFWMQSMENKTYAAHEIKQIKLKTLIVNPTFSVTASDLPYAQKVEEDIRLQLTALKEVITQSVSLPPKKTYEI